MVRRRSGALLAVVAAFFAAAPARAQDREARSRLDDLEKKLEEQRLEIEKLKLERMQKELRDAPDSPPHVDRSPDRLDPASGGSDLQLAYDDGFLLKGTLNGAKYVIRPRAFIQLDYRAFPRAGANAAFPTKGFPEERFLLRRGIVGFRGQFGVFDFLIEADPVRGQSNVIPFTNCWLEYHQFDLFRIRAGHFIPPFTWADGFVAPPNHELVEHPMIVQTLSYVFRPGAMVFGDVEKGSFAYFLSVNNELDQNNAITGVPIVTARVSTYIGGIGLGVAGSWLRIGGPARDSLTGVTPGGHRFFAPVPVRGWSQRYEVDAIVDAGPFFITAEYAWGYQQRNRANADLSDGAPLIAQGAYVTLGWMFVGAPPGSKGPHLPFQDWAFSFDLQRKRLGRNAGAEILIRGEWISIDQARGERDFKGNSAKAITVGFNIYFMENVRLTLEYVHLHIGDQSRAERAHSREADELLFRAQVEF